MSNNTHALLSGDIEAILTELSEIKNSARLVLADYKNEKNQLAAGFITPAEFIEYEQAISRRIATLQDEPDELELSQETEKASVFLSYNHLDLAMALRIKEELAKHHIKVRMDYLEMKTGGSIYKFIEELTRDNNGFVLLVSQNSLASAWVGYEINLAIFNNKIYNRRIIPLCIDNSFEDNNASIEINRKINEKIRQIDEAMLLHKYENFRTDHLEVDRNRLLDALNNLGNVLQYLRSHSVKKIVGEDFEEAMSVLARELC